MGHSQPPSSHYLQLILASSKFKIDLVVSSQFIKYLLLEKAWTLYQHGTRIDLTALLFTIGMPKFQINDDREILSVNFTKAYFKRAAKL